MSETAVPTNAVSKLVKICLQWWWVWIGTTVTFGAIGFCYVTIIKNDVWVASQGLIVRDEANGAVMRLGRFQSQAEMKAAQETIIELARNPHVLNKALTAIGPDPSKIDDGSPWPSTKDVEETAKNVMVRAPRGAELGTTEVIYLDAKHGSRKRAYELNVAICDALEDRLQEVRRSRADGVFAELTTACETAEKELALATEKLHQMEKEAAADLSDLRGMTDTGTNTNSSRIQLDAVKNELHQAEVKLREMALELELADQVLANPNHLLGPNSIVNARPGLKKLHDGLTDARINGAQVRAKFTGVHPLVSAAEKAEREIESRLREEFTQARQALIKDIALSQRRVDDLKLQQSQLEARLANIANIRAEYGNLSNDVRSRSQIFQDAQRQLSEVRAAREAASSCSLVTRIDDPLASETPVGPGRSTIFAGTTIAGLFFGLGTVFLLTPFDGGVGYGRRRSDFETSMGRRMSDRSGAGTRQSDTPATTDSTAQSLSITDTDHTDAKSLVHAAKTITKKPTSDDSPSNSMASEYAEPEDADSLKAKRRLPTKPRHK